MRNRKSNRVWISSVLFGALAGIALGVCDYLRREASPIPSAAEPSTAQTIPALRRETQRRIAESLMAVAAAQAETAPTKTHEEDLNAAAKILVKSFDALYSQRKFFDKDAIYAQVFDQLSEDRANIEAACRALTDPLFLQAAYGKEHQAIARVYAIQFLKHEAEHGDVAPLMNTTRALFASLSDDGETVRGQYQDLESLTRAILGLGYTAEELVTNGPNILRDVLLEEGQQNLGSRDDGLIDAVEAAFITATAGRADRGMVNAMTESIDAVLVGDT